jgi:DNA-binding CsgD family transcriptional regulator
VLPREISDPSPKEPADPGFRCENALRFVGRGVELDVFRATLLDPEPRFPLLYVWGSPGFGKTSLLDQMERIAEENSVPVTRVDARALHASIADGAGPLLDLNRHRGLQVVLFDQFEQLEPLEPWLRKQLLPRLPPGAVVVFASRRPPSLDWSLHGWSSCMRVLELTELSENEAGDLLVGRSIPACEHASILGVAGGTPLLLGLAGDVAEQSPNYPFVELERPGVCGIAAALMKSTCSDRDRHRALALCAVARFTTIELLERVFPRPGARALIDWLERLSFVRELPRGLHPHPLVRRTLLDELRRDHPSSYLEMDREVRAFYAEKADTDDDRASWVMDRMWLDRDVSGIGPYLDPGCGEVSAFARARPDQRRRILELVEEHEGVESSRIAAQWMKVQPQSFEVCPALTEPVSAILSTVVFSRDTPPVAKVADPVLDLVAPHARSRTRLAEGESAVLFRYLLTARAHQDPSPELNLAFVHAARRLAERRRLAFSYCAVAAPERWISVARLYGLEVEKLGRVRVRSGDLTVLAIDWRNRSFADVFSRWVQTSASELVGRAWQLATTRPMRAAPAYPAVSAGAEHDHALDELPFDEELDDERRALDELLEERVERLAAAAKLSPRERQVLNFVLLGRHADDIASVIEIAPRTARLHVSHLLTKLGAESRLDVFRVLS